jgi:hypothetical protein
MLKKMNAPAVGEPLPKATVPSPRASVVRLAIVEDDDWLRGNLEQEIGQTPGFKVLQTFSTAISTCQG